MTPVRADAGDRARFSWALFDWAQQPYNALIIGFVFGPYFVREFVGDPVQGQALYGYAVAAMGLFIAVLNPLLGAAVDTGRNPKTWLAGLSVPFVIGACGLWLAAPGALHLAPLVLAALVVSGVATELTVTIANTMLPYLARPGQLGRLSGSGWAMGYFAALAALFLFLFAFAWPEQPWLGLNKAQGEDDRIAGPLVAVWYLAFVLPLFLFVPPPPLGRPGGRPLRELGRLLRGLPRDRDRGGFLIGRMLLADGANAAGTFGPVIAAGLFGWTSSETGIFGILLAAVAGLSVWLSGRLDDRIGSKRTVLIFTGVLMLGVGGIGLIGADRLFFSLAVAPPQPGDGLFASTGERLYLVFGMLIGIAFGPVGAGPRTWMARLAPPGEEGRWFGLFGLAGRATSFAAPALIAVLTSATGDQRAAVPVVLGFLALALLVLVRVPATRD